MKRSLLILLGFAVIAAPALAGLGASTGSSGVPILHLSSLKSVLPTVAIKAESGSKAFWMSAVRLEQSVTMPEAGSLFLMGSGLLVGAIYLRKRFFQDIE